MKKINVFFVLTFILSFALSNYMSAQSKDNTNDCPELLIDNVNTTFSITLYQIYLTINVIKDNLDNEDNFESYDFVLVTTDANLDSLMSHFSKFNKKKYFSKDDYEFIFQVKNLVYLFKEDVKLLRENLEDSKDETFIKFIEMHNRVYKTMNDLFDIDTNENTDEQ